MDYSKTTEIFGKYVDIKFNDCIPKGEKQTFHERELTLYIHINKICNAKCDFCNVHKQNYSRVEFDYNKLSEVLIALIRINKLGRIAITGGETFLDIDVLDNVLFIIKQIVENPVVTINTNASMLNKIYQLKNIDVLTEIRISRHHYLDEKNNSIFRTKCASLSDISDAVKTYGGIIKLNCNLIKGYIDNTLEISNYLDAISKIGISQVGFVGLMPFNQYCIDHYVDYTKFHFPDNYLQVYNLQDRNICQCENYLYFPAKTPVIMQIYFRQVYELKCNYCRQLSYSYDNKFTEGFGGKVIY